METEQFNLTAKDGMELKATSWSCPDPKAVICIVHGLGEHSGRYMHVADFFVQNNISVFAFDLRGHGKSQGNRGHTPSHEILLDDVEEIFLCFCTGIVSAEILSPIIFSSETPTNSRVPFCLLPG